MHRIDGADHVANLFVEGDPQIGQAATKITADWLNDTVQEELLNVIEDVGIVPNKGDNTQLLQALGLHVAGEGPRFRNALINGDFQIWRREVPTSTRAINTSNFITQYVADRWRFSAGDDTAGPAALVRRFAFNDDQNEVPGKPRYYASHDQTGASTTLPPFVEQRVESVATHEGRNVAFSCYLRVASGGPFSVTPAIVQHFGTGGSPSADVRTAGTAFTVTTSWARHVFTVALPTIGGLTVGTNGDDYVAVRLELPTGQTLELHLADLQFEARSFASPYFRELQVVEALRCERYFENSLENLDPLFDTLGGVTITGADASWNSDGNLRAIGATHRFTVKKRIAPTITWWEAGTGSRGSINWGGARVVSSTEGTTRYTTGWPVVTTEPSGGDEAFTHWAADAEL